MASSSFTPIRRYHVFTSFHGPDVRKGFVSHLHNHFETKRFKTFNDQKIVRGNTIGRELFQAIRESRVAIVVLSKNYASSSWCLDELVEIFKCRKAFGQILMTIFYDVDPSDVRKQMGDFGKAFEKSCEGKTEEVKQRWTEALTHVATIAGEHSKNWVNEAEMIQKISTDISNILINTTPSSDFNTMVGLEAHLNELESLLCHEGNDDVKMIGILGPAGIGKTTIAGALYNQLSTSFQYTWFMGNLKGNCKSSIDYDDSKLSLETKLVSEIFNQTDIKVEDVIKNKEWLQNLKVLIILDDVEVKQLKTLVKRKSWFGSGSRIIVTSEDKKILKAHGIQDIYDVNFPSTKQALEILYLSAFNQSSVQDGFEELANKVAKFCSNLPLGLCVVGSSLRGESKDEWEDQSSKIEISVDREIEDVLRVGYDRLSKKYQSLFLHIACFFNNEVIGNVISVLADSNLDVRNGLKTLADKSLIYISMNGKITMHHLLQQLGRKIVLEQSEGCQFLVEAKEINDIMTNKTGTSKTISVIGISFDTTHKTGTLSNQAFEGMPNLQFLRISSTLSGNLYIPSSMTYLPRLRSLHWNHYPRKNLPPRFQTECLVELHMPKSNLEKLWDEIKPLPNLKTLDLNWSEWLEEIPNLSKATNLEKLNLTKCINLVELPSSILNLHKLKKLYVGWCKKLKVIPANINLPSLEEVDMRSCSRLRSFPDISTNIKILAAGDTRIEEVPPAIVEWSRLERLEIGGRSLQRLTHAPRSITWLNLSFSDIEKIPDCVTSLPHLKYLLVVYCIKLKSILALESPLLESLNANNCVSLKSVCCSFQKTTKILTFSNCWSLDKDSRRKFLHQLVYGYVCLPGKKIPGEFTDKATGNSVTIALAPGTFSVSSRLKACIHILPVWGLGRHTITCSLRSKEGGTVHICKSTWFTDLSQSEHLFILHGDLSIHENICYETMSEVTFEFSFPGHSDKIIECGVRIMPEGTEGSSSSEVNNVETESNKIEVDYNHHTNGNDDGDEDYEADGSKFSQVENIKTPRHIVFWSWLRKLGLKKKKED